MIEYPILFDAVVIGGGHAGCEAAHALARSGFQTDALASLAGTGVCHIEREMTGRPDLCWH